MPNRKTARTSRVRGGKPGASNPSLEGRPDCYCWTHERSIEARTLGYAGDASRTEPGGYCIRSSGPIPTGRYHLSTNLHPGVMMMRRAHRLGEQRCSGTSFTGLGMGVLGLGAMSRFLGSLALFFCSVRNKSIRAVLLWPPAYNRDGSLARVRVCHVDEAICRHAVGRRSVEPVGQGPGWEYDERHCRLTSLSSHHC